MKDDLKELDGYHISDKVTWQWEEHDLCDRPLGEFHIETGFIERLFRDAEGCMFAQIRVSGSCFHIVNLEVFEPLGIE